MMVTTIGEADGAFVGLLVVGEFEGGEDGLLVGEFVGLSVGEAVLGL